MTTTFCTLARWRTMSGLTTSDISDAQANEFLEEASRQVVREGFIFIREELVSKDSNSKYFTSYKYFADSNIGGSIGSSDVTVYEYDSTEKELVDITSHIDEIDELNQFFKLSTGYPTNSRSVYINYYTAKQPNTELAGSGKLLEEATSEYTTFLAFRFLKTKRLRNGIVSWGAAGENVTVDEKSFDEMVQLHIDRYKSVINRIKPFYGRKMRVGRGSERVGVVSRKEPLTYRGRLLW